MFRQMRREKQQLSDSETLEILSRGISGVLAVSGDDGYPYTVPLNYVYFNGKIYFHCAKVGHKIDAIVRSDKVSFCVIDRQDILSEKFATLYKSVVAFGRARIIDDADEKRASMDALAEHVTPMESIEHRNSAITHEFDRLNMIGIEIDHITGKQALDLIGK
ncbi:MAG: pyridoxamine 5'-phosphate oxidase family protein [Oscillospiraceae bacterium]|nr:pyridoxamine 5'-phosphate oxidase family protein [Oscillospiraceae bacterium]